ncbi:hypothetical protein CBR_g41339 [Chara braunii]|uniref:Integrase catalytic domain-containing protein n=1 Tax=Chara braunii TaxID=69332 RepID=A0A388LVI8_CHABU|nr:hypothetical protein CBR_g41339 [Chara braunii]|eukprot:GBG86344.1 hypothetical protein CBR_g41339 [Chara braunii]
MVRWLSPPVYSSDPEIPIDVREGLSVVLPEEGTWTDLEPAYETVMLDEKDAFLWIETIWTKVNLTRLSPSLMDLEFRGTVEARGWVYLSQDLENEVVIGLVLGVAPTKLFRQAEREMAWAACQRAKMEMDKIDVRVELGDRKSMRRPLRTMRKPNKTLRWIQDLQKLNAVTIRDAGSLPQADLLAESHAGRSIYSLVDLYSGYDQLPLDARDRPYTAMHTPVGQLQMQVTPMGFTNAVAEAQRRMLAVTGDMFPEKCEPYIDDNPVKGARYKDETKVEPGVRKFIWDHLQDIKDLLQRGDFVVDNEMADATLTTGQLLIQTLEKGTPAVVAELREGPATTVRRKEENDSWGADLGTREELMAMAVEGGGDAVMTLAKTWAQKECQYLVNQTREEQGTDQKEQEFFLIQMYEGVFREIDLMLVGNKQPTEVSPKAREEVETYVLRNDQLFKKEEGMMPRRVVCGRSRQLDVIQAMHDGLVGGNRSSEGTLAKIVPLYFWPGMAGMVATYCQTCLICQEWSSVRIYEPLRPTRVLGPGHLVHLDLAVMPVSTDGFRYILDARDNLSGYVEAVALKRKTGKAVADWVEDFYLRHPFMRRFIADNGTKFVNQEVLSRLKALCVPIKITEPYHPEANAPVERGHRTLKNTIAKLAADNLGSWPRYLKQAVFAENMTPKRTTGCIPAELWYEREIDFPVEALIPTWNRLDDNPHLTTKELITTRCQQVARNEEALEEVVNRVTDSQMKDKARWDQVKNIRKEPLQVGENVLVRNSALESSWSGQLGKRFKGPYMIAKRVGLNAFELEDLDGTSIRGPFPGQRLTRSFSRDPVEQWLQEAQDRESGELTI